MLAQYSMSGLAGSQENKAALISGDFSILQWKILPTLSVNIPPCLQTVALTMLLTKHSVCTAMKYIILSPVKTAYT